MWQGVLGHLEQELSQANFEVWVKGSVLLTLEENKVVVGVYNSSAKKCLESKLGSKTKEVILNALGRELASRFVAVKPRVK